MDLFFRKGMPVIAKQNMQYEKPLKIFNKFYAIMDLHDWDKKTFHMTHEFYYW